MSGELDLGNLALELKHSGLELHLSSKAKFTASVEDDIDELQRRLTHCLLDSDSNCRPWFSRGSSFKLVLDLRIETVMERQDQNALIEVLSTQLRVAKLWQQLHYSQPSVQTAWDDTTQAYRIEVSLTHADEAIEHSNRKLHKLGVDVPFYDVRPPAGVCSASIDSAHLDMQIQKRSMRKRRRLRLNDNLNTVAFEAGNATNGGLIDDTDAPFRELCSEELFTSSAPPGDDSPRQSEWPLESEDEEDVNYEARMLLEADEETTTDALKLFPSLPSLLKRASNASDLDTDSREACKGAILELVDAALRSVISGPPTRIAKGIPAQRSKSFQALATIAPSLWCPGHLPAVGSRAVFLPTISHAVTAICTKHAESRKLQSKAANLTKLALKPSSEYDPFISSEVEDEPPSQVSSEMLAIQIWHTLERGMYNAEAARRLKSINIRTSDSAEDAKYNDELLEASQKSYEDAAPDDIEEEEDFLLDPDIDPEDCDYDDDLLEGMYEDSANESIDEHDYFKPGAHGNGRGGPHVC